MEAEAKKQAIIEAGLKLVSSGLIARTWGNMSYRVDDRSFLITPSGKRYEGMTPEDIVEVDIDTLHYHGKVKPSSEKGIHAEVYARFPKVQFVIHTHQDYASAMSVTGLPYIETDPEYKTLGGRVPLAAYALPGTKKLRANVAAVLKDVKGQGLIMSQHGALCFGEDPTAAFTAAAELERACLKVFKAKFEEKFHEDVEKTELDFSKIVSGSRAAVRPHITHEADWSRNTLIATPEIIAYSEHEHVLLPYLDDFAQIVGSKCRFIQGKGAFLMGSKEQDIEALKIVIRKNCLAFFAGVLFDHNKPISNTHSFLMRIVYKYKYSKQIK